MGCLQSCRKKPAAAEGDAAPDTDDFEMVAADEPAAANGDPDAAAEPAAADAGVTAETTEGGAAGDASANSGQD